MQEPLIAPVARRARTYCQPRLLGELLLAAVAAGALAAALAPRAGGRSAAPVADGACISPECMHALGGGQMHGCARAAGAARRARGRGAPRGQLAPPRGPPSSLPTPSAPPQRR
jgi:hypothetical protein